MIDPFQFGDAVLWWETCNRIRIRICMRWLVTDEGIVIHIFFLSVDGCLQTCLCVSV